jgi:DNA modification methylase
MSDFLNAVWEGDCLEGLAFVADRSVDMVLCDLPYGVTQNAWDREIDLGELWRHYERVIKDNGVMALFGQGGFTAKLIMSNPALFRYKVVWIKMKPTNFLNVRYQPLRKHEDICIFYKRQPVYHPQMVRGAPYDKGSDKGKVSDSYGEYSPRRTRNFAGNRHPSDVLFLPEDEVPDWWFVKTPTVSGQSFHPTVKPVALGRWLIRMFTDPGAVVLDNACGSGTFLVAAILEGRQFIGMEKNGGSVRHGQPADYVAIARSRIELAYKDFRNEAGRLRLF